MHFCSKCDNMYYISIDDLDPNSLLFYCKKCGNKDKSFANNKTCIAKINFKQSTENFDHLVNEYTKYDPTLPRINNINCPNDKCKNNEEIIYIRYDNENMKYLYLCPKCDNVWKTDQFKN